MMNSSITAHVDENICDSRVFCLNMFILPSVGNCESHFRDIAYFVKFTVKSHDSSNTAPIVAFQSPPALFVNLFKKIPKLFNYTTKRTIVN